MSTSTAAPATRNQPSRKGKKAWRKNVDITEVQAGLEEAREEVIQGGIISEKPSDELFILDTTGSEAIKKKHLKDAKPLKAEEIIAARASAVAGLNGRKRKSLTDLAPVAKRNKTYVSHEELQRLKALAFSGANRAENIVQQEGADQDLWAVQPKVQDPRFSFLEEKRPTREPRTLKQQPVSLAASGKPFAAVKRPEAGKSYNPDFEDWQELMTKTGDKEVEAEKKRLREANEEAEKTAKALAEAAKPEPGSEEEYESAWESEWEGIRSEGEEVESLNKKRPERKTPAERNKIKRRKEAERLAKHEAQVRQYHQQQDRIKEIAREVKKKEAARARSLALMQTNSSDESEDEVLKRRFYGKSVIPDAPLEIVLADELQDSLRALRPEGNLIKDRFRNYLVNGKIEARKAVTQPKKPKRERTEKWSYKDWKLR